MKFLHTADLHIGKKIFELSLIEDQRKILDQIYDIACEEQVDAVVVAGDVYDRAVPSTEAVTLLDRFLTRFSSAGIPVMMVSGNHDSPERVAFGEHILEKQGLYIAGTYAGEVKTVTFQDLHGPVTFVCLPFVKPAVTGCSTSAEAVEQMLSSLSQERGSGHRYVLITHYFVTGEQGELPELSDSESEANVGGLDSVPASLMKAYDYVALGHIHKPQRVGSGNAYYSGAPLKYSFGEASGEKSVNIVELGVPGELSVKRRSLTPLHEMRCIRGELEQLISKEVRGEVSVSLEDYLQVTLTDRVELIDPMATLRSVYPNVLQILMQKNLEQESDSYESRIPDMKKSTAELFCSFYEMLKGEPPDEKRRTVVEEVAAEAENMENTAGGLSCYHRQ